MNLSFQPVQLWLQFAWPIMQELIDVTQRILDLNHRIDRTLRHAQTKARLKQQKQASPF